MLLRWLVGCVVVCSFSNIGVNCASNVSSTNQQKILNQIFSSYNKNIRPVENESLPVEIQFGIRLTKILGVNSKSQDISVNVWITQKWTNPFMKWNPDKVGGLTSIVVDSKDVWVPDIGLFNNADESFSLAGGSEKFKTPVLVKNNGVNTWRSPATFKSDCEISVRYWPFDTQKCKLFFASFTYSNEQLILTLLKQTDNKADSFATNGDWEVDFITLEKLPEKQYDKVSMQITLRRRPAYFILNLITPSVVLCLLTLFSFAIPSESGERIGFITTLLLAMTVYLLLIADVLPETSKELPITALLFVMMILETAMILLFTIVTLRCYYGVGEPYRWLQRLYCSCCPCTNKIPSGTEKTSRTKVLPNGVTNDGGDGNDPYDIPAVFKHYESKEFDHPTWQDISIFVNRLFFVVSFIMVVSTFLVVFLNAAYFSQTP